MTMLAQKLHPDRFTAMSPKMAAIVGYILGEAWTEPTIEDLNITSDEFVVALTSVGDDIIGSASDLERNLFNLIKAAELTDKESQEFLRLCRGKVTDWRRGRTLLKR